MKAIVDTCAWSLSLRRQDQARISADEQQIIESLKEAIRDGRAVLIGPVRQEILSGIRDKAKFAKTRSLLAPFDDEPIIPNDFVEAARLFNLCRDHGVECGPVDILMCAVAVRMHYEILTSDKGLNRCIEVLRAEGLMR